MKGKTRKLLSVLLALVLCVGLLPMGAVATGETTTVQFKVTTANNVTAGTVSYRFGDSGDFTSVNTANAQDGVVTVNVAENATTVTVKVTTSNGVYVNQSNSRIDVNGSSIITDSNKSAFFTSLTGETGYTYTLTADTPQFVIEFDNNDGTGSNPSNPSNPQNSGISLGLQGESLPTYNDDTFKFANGTARVAFTVGNSENAYNGTPQNSQSGTELELGAIPENTAAITLTLTPAEGYSAQVRVGGQSQTVDNNIMTYTIPQNPGNHIIIDVRFTNNQGGNNQGGDNPHPVNPAIAFNAEHDDEEELSVSNGTFTATAKKDNKTLGKFIVTLDKNSQSEQYNGNNTTIDLTDVTSVTIAMTPAEGLNGYLITGGDTPSGALVRNSDNNYTAYPNKFKTDDQGNIFLGLSVRFAKTEQDPVDFTAVIWNGDQVEHKSENGTISVKSIEVGNTTYIYDTTDNRFKNNGEESSFLLQWYQDDDGHGESGVRVGDGAFADENTDVYINFVFKPDYGYQVTGVGTNEDATSLMDGVTAATEISTFKFKVIKHDNPHFTVVFSPKPDEFALSGVTTAATIANGSNATDSGNLKLTVGDMSEQQIASLATYQDLATTDTPVYVSMSLDQVVSKGTANDNWTNSITQFDDPITITLNIGATPGVVYYVVRYTSTNQLDRIAATNNGDGTISFQTNHFSDYMLVKTAETIPTSYIPDTGAITNTNTTNTTDTTPADTTPAEPATDVTVEVTASVSDDGTATVSTVSEETIAAIAKSTEEQQNVVFDLSGLGDDVTAVSMPAESFEKVAGVLSGREGTSDSVTIVTGSGEVQFDETAVAAIAGEIDGGTVEFSLENTGADTLNDAQQEAFETMENAEVLAKYELNLTVSGNPVSDFKGGTVTVGVPFTPKANTSKRDYGVYYASASGALERRVTGYEGGKLTFRTGRFSDYVVVHEETKNNFTDVSASDYYYDAVLWANANGVTTGVTNTTFVPDHVCTRAQMVTFLWRAAGSPKPQTTVSTLKDVAAGEWYSDAVLWAIENGVTNGIGGEFRPNDQVTRAQAVTFLYRMAGKKTAGTNVFSDVEAGTWYTAPVLWAIENNVTNGTNGLFSPALDCPRSQIVTFIYRTFVK